MTAMPGEGAPTTPNNNATNGGFEDVAPKKSPDRLGRKILATSVALASMISAGCSDKDSNNKESRNSYDSGKPTATEFVPDKTSSDGSSNAIIETGDVIVTETQKNTGDLPKINKAEPEQGQNCPVYRAENTDVEPAINVDNYILSETPGGAPERPNGYFDLTKLCEELGIDNSEIEILGGGSTLVGKKSEIAVEFTKGYNVRYWVNDELICFYSSGESSGIANDGMSFYRQDPESGKYEYCADIHYSPTALGVTEIMLRAKADQKTGDPLALAA